VETGWNGVSVVCFNIKRLTSFQVFQQSVALSVICN